MLTYLEKSNNEIYNLLEDIPRYIALGVTTLEIQGREYPTPLIAELTKIYRKLIDQTREGFADVARARAALDPILADRDSIATPRQASSTAASWPRCQRNCTAA